MLIKLLTLPSCPSRRMAHGGKIGHGASMLAGNKKRGGGIQGARQPRKLLPRPLRLNDADLFFTAVLFAAVLATGQTNGGVDYSCFHLDSALAAANTPSRSIGG